MRVKNNSKSRRFYFDHWRGIRVFDGESDDRVLIWALNLIDNFFSIFKNYMCTLSPSLLDSSILQSFRPLTFPPTDIWSHRVSHNRFEVSQIGAYNKPRHWGELWMIFIGLIMMNNILIGAMMMINILRMPMDCVPSCEGATSPSAFPNFETIRESSIPQLKRRMNNLRFIFFPIVFYFSLDREQVDYERLCAFVALPWNGIRCHTLDICTVSDASAPYWRGLRGPRSLQTWLRNGHTCVYACRGALYPRVVVGYSWGWTSGRNICTSKPSRMDSSEDDKHPQHKHQFWSISIALSPFADEF